MSEPTLTEEDRKALLRFRCGSETHDTLACDPDPQRLDWWRTPEGRAAEIARHRAEAATAALAPFEELFAGGPDTLCRTTYPGGVVECVEVPMEDLRAAFARAAIAQGREDARP